MRAYAPPETEQELLSRCQNLAGKTLAWLAHNLETALPNSFIHSKGWVGQSIEAYLGADSASLSQPDFAHLGIELKTLPLNDKNEPKESTYVCTAPITLGASLETWENSRVYAKLARVLWIPFEAAPHIPIANRKIGSALLWCLSGQDEKMIQKDWQELTEMLMFGQVNQITGKFGIYLHIRPKAMHSRILNETIDEQGETIMAGPKGFYLRTDFTKKILSDYYCKIN